LHEINNTDANACHDSNQRLSVLRTRIFKRPSKYGDVAHASARTSTRWEIVKTKAELLKYGGQRCPSGGVAATCPTCRQDQQGRIEADAPILFLPGEIANVETPH
jgi:hypothetical protein